MYHDVSVVIDGALDQDKTVADGEDLDLWLDYLHRDLDSKGLSAEVYVVSHDHVPADCECVQYLTDHRPIRLGVGADR